MVTEDKFGWHQDMNVIWKPNESQSQNCQS